MMALEKKLALTDLKGYYEEQKWRTLAKEIVQYQNFKSNKAAEKILGDWKTCTKKNYFNIGLRYMRSGFRDAHVGVKFYDFIDEAIEKCTQPLTPSISDKRHQRRINIQSKKATIPDVMQQPTTVLPTQLISKFEYGVRRGDLIVIMANEQVVNDFVSACKRLGIDDIKIVNITVE